MTVRLVLSLLLSVIAVSARRAQLFPAYDAINQLGGPSNIPSINNNELNSRKLLAEERSLQHNVGAIVEEVSEIKSTIFDLVPHVKDILDTLRIQNTPRKSEETVNVNIKLDPSFEALIKQFFHLIEATTEKEEEILATKSIEDTEESQEEDGGNFGLYTTTEGNSEENTTAEADSSAESSSEENVKEVSDENYSENIQIWLRKNFGPTVTAGNSDEEIESIFKNSSEEENSAEKSDESFETWFKSVYGGVTTAATNDDYPEETTQSSHESNETAEEESNQNSTAEIWVNKSEDETSESLEASTVRMENVDNKETYFVPTTAGTDQEDTFPEYMDAGNKYSYALDSYAKEELMKIDCLIIKFKIKFDKSDQLFKKYKDCMKILQETKTVADSGSGESTESDETESAIINNFTESEGSGVPDNVDFNEFMIVKKPITLITYNVRFRT